MLTFVNKADNQLMIIKVITYMYILPVPYLLYLCAFALTWRVPYGIVQRWFRTWVPYMPPVVLPLQQQIYSVVCVTSVFDYFRQVISFIYNFHYIQLCIISAEISKWRVHQQTCLFLPVDLMYRKHKCDEWIATSEPTECLLPLQTIKN
jgi:hypothetical protein